jgi:hypothetical protein
MTAPKSTVAPPGRLKPPRASASSASLSAGASNIGAEALTAGESVPSTKAKKREKLRTAL